MEEDNRTTRDTVVVEKDRNSSSLVGWIVGLIVVLVLVAIFFMSGGFGLFSGAATPQGGDTINVDTPDAVNVQPSGQ